MCLLSQGLKLVADPSVIRASILPRSALVVQFEDGTAFDAEGAVYTANGIRQRDRSRKSTTLPMDEATLVVQALPRAALTPLAEVEAKGHLPQ